MTEEYYAQLEPILHAIPEQALTPLDPPVFFSESLNGNDALSLGFYDKANYILVEIHWGSRELVLVTYPGADDFTHYHTQDALYWSIDSPELAQLMEQFSQTNITVTLFATRQDYIHYGPSQASFGNSLGAQSVTIAIPRGWGVDSYLESQGSPETIFRLMPEGVDSGSITFQLYEKDTFAGCGLGSSTEAITVGKYPATAIYYDGSDQWTYLQIPGKTCDLVIVNEAGDWFRECEAEILSILATLDAPECYPAES